MYPCMCIRIIPVVDFMDYTFCTTIFSFSYILRKLWILSNGKKKCVQIKNWSQVGKKRRWDWKEGKKDWKSTALRANWRK